jgi:long-chain acyl-CoA synthetase
MNQSRVFGSALSSGYPSSQNHLPDYRSARSLPEVWAIAAQCFGSVTAVHDPHSNPEIKLTYEELYQQMQQFAVGLQTLGIQAGNHIALFADNSPRWLIADQGIMMAGAANAVRGTQADREELLFILGNSDSIALVVQDRATLKKLATHLVDLPLRFIVLLSDEAPSALESDFKISDFKIFNFTQLMQVGAEHSVQPIDLNPESLATLVYTSGTSGMPKGVMLSHGNLLSQIISCPTVVQPLPGERVLSVLPIWHSYERSFEYFIFSSGCTQIYTNIRYVKKDLKEFKPHYMVAVPRLWESIYEGVQKQFREQPPSKQRLIDFFLHLSQRYILARRLVQGLSLDHLHPSIALQLWASLQMAALWLPHQLGKRLVYRQVRAAMGGAVKYLVSGGGSIAEHLEDFFEIVGLEILGGYGLTETAPITHVRRPWHNLRGADGQPLPQTETCIVDLETRQPLAVGKQGLVLIRGSQVMQGYYNNPEATAKVIDPEGWFDTGDLGWVTDQNDLVITGRAKDTIVLTNGENIEPQPIEDACLRSPYIDQIMLVGQDQRSIGAFIVPNSEALEKWIVTQNLQIRQPDGKVDPENQAVQELFRQELMREVKNRPGYRADDRIGTFRLLSEPFTVENGMMTQTLKIRRAIVTERYRGMIDDMFA